jgi:hypothetical protein
MEIGQIRKEGGFWIHWKKKGKGAKKVKLKVRSLPMDELSEITDDYTETEYVRKGGKGKDRNDMIPVSTTDNVGMIKEICKRSLLGWEGITENGKPLPFNDKNRDYLITTFTDLPIFINETCGDYEAIQAALVKDEIKN